MSKILKIISRENVKNQVSKERKITEEESNECSINFEGIKNLNIAEENSDEEDWNGLVQERELRNPRAMDSMVIKKDMRLYKRSYHTKSPSDRLCIPDNMKAEVLRLAHNTNHYSTKKIYNELKDGNVCWKACTKTVMCTVNIVMCVQEETYLVEIEEPSRRQWKFPGNLS